MNSTDKTSAALSADQNNDVRKSSVKGEYATVNGLKMYYEIHGAGRPLVSIHGSFMSGTFYPTLAEGRQFIVVDMQGHGHTADIDRPFTFEQMADDVAALLEHLGIEKTDVFGYSMGGTIGLALAIRRPNLVRRLAIYGSVYRPMEESYQPENLRDFKAITPENFAPPEIKEPYEKMSPAPDWRQLVEKILQMEIDFKGFTKEQMRAIKAEIFIGGGDRYDTRLEHLVEMHDLIPKSQLAIFPNTDHVVLMKHPNRNNVFPPMKEFFDGGE